MPPKLALPAGATILLCACLLALLHPDSHSISARTASSSHLPRLPKVILWAWERPEDLRFLAPQRAGVAFLAQTILLPSTSSRLTLRPRLQLLRTAPSAPLVAVVRIESPAASESFAPPDVSDEVRGQIATQIAAMQDLPGVREVQIDFDATTSQRTFYFALLQDVRQKLRRDMPLSITALASWCIGDPWLNQLPPGTIDEAVPMLFRMSADASAVGHFVESGREFTAVACRGSLGVSTDEPFLHPLATRQRLTRPSFRGEKRIYVFAPGAWTPAAANRVLQEWQP